MPDSATEKNNQIFAGDCIYSVNGIMMNNMSHPQALQILKQCGSNVKIILFREKSKDKELLEQSSPHIENSRKHSHTTQRFNGLPGSVTTDARHMVKRPPFIRKVTSGLSGLSIPQIGDNVTETGNENNSIRKDSQNTLFPPSRSDDESEVSSIRSSVKSIPKCIALNKRINSGPFMIEYEKMFKGLGIQVMMDKDGECYITDVSPNGLLGKDNKIRSVLK